MDFSEISKASCIVCRRKCPARSACDHDCPFEHCLPAIAVATSDEHVICDPRIRDVLSKLNDTCSHLPDIEGFASLYRVGASRLNHLFRSETGMTIKQCVCRRHMRMAARLLLTTWFHPSEIAYFVGYETVAGFDHAFKSIIGLSPTAYRAKHGYAQACRAT